MNKKHCSLHDDVVFSSIYERFKQPLWRFVRAKGVQKRDVEDVFQEIMLAIHRFVAEKKVDTIEALVFKVAKNKISDYFRRQPDNISVFPLDSLDGDEPHVEAEAPATTGMWRLIASVGLSAVQQEAVVLHYMVGYSPREVAVIMGAGELTTKSRLYLARRKIRRHLQLRRETA